MAVLNLTPDSFWSQSRVSSSDILSRARSYASQGASYIDIGAVSTRPGAARVDTEQEWQRLEPALCILRPFLSELPAISIDTTSSEIVRRCYDLLGSFVVNDISSGEDDPEMLHIVGRLGLQYIAMHKRGNPRTMDSLCDYPQGIIPELVDYFRKFELKASDSGIRDWILDPGLGFAKTAEQNWEILERLPELKALGRPILIGAADKRFTSGSNSRAHSLAIAGGASILRVHEII